jgi:hypothetical protein
VLVDQDECRSWRMCVSGCPYKTVRVIPAPTARDCSPIRLEGPARGVREPASVPKVGLPGASRSRRPNSNRGPLHHERAKGYLRDSAVRPRVLLTYLYIGDLRPVRRNVAGRQGNVQGPSPVPKGSWPQAAVVAGVLGEWLPTDLWLGRGRSTVAVQLSASRGCGGPSLKTDPAKLRSPWSSSPRAPRASVGCGLRPKAVCRASREQPIAFGA